MTAPEPAYAPPVCGLCGVRLVFDDMRASWVLRVPLSQRNAWLDADYDDGDHGDPGCCAEGTYGEGLGHVPAMLTADQAWDEPLPKRTVRIVVPHMAVGFDRTPPVPSDVALTGVAMTAGGLHFETTFEVADASPLADLLRGGAEPTSVWPLLGNDIAGDGIDGVIRQRRGLEDVVFPRLVRWPWLPERVRGPLRPAVRAAEALLTALRDLAADLAHDL